MKTDAFTPTSSEPTGTSGWPAREKAEGAAEARAEHGHSAHGDIVRATVVAVPACCERQDQSAESPEPGANGPAFPVLIADLLPNTIRKHGVRQSGVLRREFPRRLQDGVEMKLLSTERYIDRQTGE
jgi:hypothetical protein